MTCNINDYDRSPVRTNDYEREIPPQITDKPQYEQPAYRPGEAFERLICSNNMHPISIQPSQMGRSIQKICIQPDWTHLGGGGGQPGR